MAVEMTKAEIEAQVDLLKKRVAKGKEMQASAGGKLDSAKNSLAAVDGEIKDLGVDPENIDDEVEKLKALIIEHMQKADEHLPADAVKE